MRTKSSLKKKRNNKKIVKRGRGRPRKPKPTKILWKLPEGVHLVSRRLDHHQALTHRWIAYADKQVIGYYRTPEEAIAAIKK